MIIGAGPIVIGQACEFDYSGAQACKALREEGYRVILVNSNPATIMTDPEMADATYIEPITPEIVAKIIEAERPDALLPTMGGQTGLNTALALDDMGVLAKFNVELIGAKREAIEKAEDRKLFREAMERIGLENPKATVANTLEEALAAIEHVGLPAIIRPAFTLGGTGGGVAYNREDYERIVQDRPRRLPRLPDPDRRVASSAGRSSRWRWSATSATTASSSARSRTSTRWASTPATSITVAPALTLTDKEYQMMRNASIAVLREIGVETGGSNVQFAVHPETGRLIVIEMNPRVSRSSALASKATGFPIAKIAAKLAVGYTLDELDNDITQVTPASFEPTIDYVVTKIPRFAFEKFPGAEPLLTTAMKSVGEAMAIGRTFHESRPEGPLLARDRPHRLRRDRHPRRRRPRRQGHHRHGPLRPDPRPPPPRRPGHAPRPHRRRDPRRHPLRPLVPRPHPRDRRRGGPPRARPASPASRTRSAASSSSASPTPASPPSPPAPRPASAPSASASASAPSSSASTPAPPSSRRRPPTCTRPTRSSTAATPSARPAPPTDRKVVILGGGPNRIGQGIEFDYCCCHACFALTKAGYETIMVNCNPETVSTDYDTSDRLYFEPLTLEHVLEILRVEQENGTLHGVIVQFGGQTPLKLANALHDAGIPILGTTPDAIDLAEDRERFQALLHRLGLRQPDERHRPLPRRGAWPSPSDIGYPLVIRPSYVLGGRAMEIVRDDAQLTRYIRDAVQVSGDTPVLLDSYLSNAIEVDVDAISDGRDVHIAGVMEHIEEAGVHSGDSACSLPPYSLDARHHRRAQAPDPNPWRSPSASSA